MLGGQGGTRTHPITAKNFHQIELALPWGGAVADKPADLNPIDPDLARVVSVWPTLPEGIRNAVMAVVASVSQPR